MNVLGLDLSLTATGIAYPDGSVDTWGPKLKGIERLDWFYRSMISLTDSKIDLVVLEAYAFHAHGAHYAGELGGVVRLALHHRALPWVAVAPTSLKKYATGKGNVKKVEMVTGAREGLGYGGHDDNEADALWLRAMAMDWYGTPVVKMPAENRKALSRVSWPDLSEDEA